MAECKSDLQWAICTTQMNHRTASPSGTSHKSPPEGTELSGHIRLQCCMVQDSPSDRTGFLWATRFSLSSGVALVSRMAKLYGG